MKCYCINLDRDVDRRAWVEAQASAAGLVLTRVPAVLGSTLGAEELARHRAATDHAGAVALKDLSPNDLAPHDLSPGEVGCLLSHVRALRLFVESDEPHALIIEDDVHIALDARKLLADLAAEHLPAFDLIKLEATPMRTFVSRAYRRLPGERRLHDLLSFNLGTAAYLVKRSTAIELIERLESSMMPCDYALCSPETNGLKIGQLQPAPFIQDNFKHGVTTLRSSIGERPSHRRRKHRLLWAKALANQLYNIVQIPRGRQRIRIVWR